MKRFLFCLLLLFLAVTSFAKENKISQSQAILAELRDPTGEENERVIRVKEVESGKVTQLTLEKDPATPQIWSGYFVIQFVNGDNSVHTLDFVNAQNESYFASISQEKSIQKVTLFKTADELAVYEAGIAEEQQKAAELKQRTAEKELAKQIQLAKPNKVGAAVGKEKMEQLVRQQGRLQETTQLSMEESQAKRRALLTEQFQKLSANEQQSRAAQAAKIILTADEAYAKRKYKEAATLYSQAIDLNPTVESYYYRYGVTLYKTGNYNKSLAILSLAEVESEQKTEKEYYVALNHLKLKDYDKARKEFIEIREENSPQLSPTSSFFAGNIEFQQQKFPEARKSMEYVIDNSKDPKLDRSAEEMMEKIDRMEAYYESKREKFRLSFFTGLIYDTNVLNVAENNASTDAKGWRLNYGGSVLGFLHRTPNSDLAAQLSLADYYSVNSTFKADATLQAADAMDVGASLPYHREIKISPKRSMNLEVVPSYRNIYMAPFGGTREVVVRSTGLSTTLGSSLKSDVLLSGRLDLGKDESLLSSSVGDDDLSASKAGFTLIPVKLLDLQAERILSGEISYNVNAAVGKNNRYQRYALAGTYSCPAWAKGTGIVRLDYSLQDYNQATTARKDTVISLSASYTKDLNKRWNWLLSAQYTNAISEVDTYQYNKYLVTSLFTYTTSILSQ